MEKIENVIKVAAAAFFSFFRYASNSVTFIDFC